MLLEAMYFFIPAYVANMMPVFLKNVNILNFPVDFGKIYNGKRILGSHKTWRGLVFGTLAGFLVFELQRILFNNNIFTNLALIDYTIAPVFLGLLLGFSALLGDMVESFFKRRLKIVSGKPWVPFDQLDFLLFSIILTAPFSSITLNDSLLTLAVVFFGTLLVQYSGYKLKLKKDVL